MTIKKPTKRDHFTALLNLPEVASNPEFVAFITHEIDLLNRKNSVEKKPTAKQMENEATKTAIYDYMLAQPNRMFSITELTKEVPECEGMTGQKVSAIVRQMLDTKIKRIEDKRKAFFQVIAPNS